MSKIARSSSPASGRCDHSKRAPHALEGDADARHETGRAIAERRALPLRGLGPTDDGFAVVSRTGLAICLAFAQQASTVVTGRFADRSTKTAQATHAASAVGRPQTRVRVALLAGRAADGAVRGEATGTTNGTSVFAAGDPFALDSCGGVDHVGSCVLHVRRRGAEGRAPSDDEDEGAEVATSHHAHQRHDNLRRARPSARG